MRLYTSSAGGDLVRIIAGDILLFCGGGDDLIVGTGIRSKIRFGDAYTHAQLHTARGRQTELGIIASHSHDPPGDLYFLKVTRNTKILSYKYIVVQSPRISSCLSRTLGISPLESPLD